MSRPSAEASSSGDANGLTAASMATEEFIARKEAELQAAINEHYARMRGQEKELRDLQLQLKVTTGPKKSALEHLRRLIEAQTEKVSAARVRHVRVEKEYKAATELLEKEEAVKASLCKELNDLIQESVNTQVNRIDELMSKVHALEAEAAGLPRNGDAGARPEGGSGGGGAAAHDGASTQNPDGAGADAASGRAPHEPASTATSATTSHGAKSSADNDAGRPPGDATASGVDTSPAVSRAAAPAESAVSAADRVAAERLAAIEAEKEAVKARREAAKAAKSRHVQLGRKGSGAGQAKASSGMKLSQHPTPEKAPSPIERQQPAVVVRDGLFAGFNS